MPKMSVDNILKNPRDLINNIESLIENEDTLKSLTVEQQSQFATNLVADATESELNIMAGTIGRAFGGLEAPKLQEVLIRAISARSDIYKMIGTDNLSSYILGESSIQDVKFNPDLFREFPNLLSKSLKEDELHDFINKIIDSCQSSRDLSNVSRSFNITFQSHSTVLAELIAIKHTLNLATSQNPTDILLDKTFNPGLITHYFKYFESQLEGHVNEVAAKILNSGLSNQELSKISRILEQIQPNATEHVNNSVSQLHQAISLQHEQSLKASNNGQGFFTQPNKATHNDNNVKCPIECSII